MKTFSLARKRQTCSCTLACSFAAFTLVALAGNAHAQIIISTVGDGFGYDILGTGAADDEGSAFRSTDVAKTVDIDFNNEYGSEGVFFFGTNGEAGNGKPWEGNTTTYGAPWVTSFAAGANFVSISEQVGYGPYDNPTLSGASVEDWSMSGIGVATGGGIGNWAEVLTFSAGENTPETFRLGIFSGSQPAANGRWDPTGLRLSVDGGVATEVNDLELTDGANPGWVFFDVDLNGETGGTFSIEGQNRLAGQGTALSGVTFDVPSGGFILGDFNEDTVVNEVDFEILALNLGKHLDGPIDYFDGDIDFNSAIDLQDLDTFKRLYPAVAALAWGVPEPTAFGLLALSSGLLLTSARSRRFSR